MIAGFSVPIWHQRIETHDMQTPNWAINTPTHPALLTMRRLFQKEEAPPERLQLSPTAQAAAFLQRVYGVIGQPLPA